MAALPEGFWLRPPKDVDAAPLVEMLNAETLALIGVSLATVEWVVTPWHSPGADRERDFAVVVDPDGAVAGYVSVGSDPPYTEVLGIGVVALPHHGRGHRGGGGRRVRAPRAAGSSRWPRPSPRGHAVGALADEPRVAGLLRAHGYTEVRRFIAMRIDFAGTPAPA